MDRNIQGIMEGYKQDYTGYYGMDRNIQGIMEGYKQDYTGDFGILRDTATVELRTKKGIMG